MNTILFDAELHKNFLPLTHTRPIAEIRCGIFTARERWDFLNKQDTGFLTETYLQKQFPQIYESNVLYLNAAAIIAPSLHQAILKLKNHQVLKYKHHIIALHSHKSFTSYSELIEATQEKEIINFHSDLLLLEKPWHIFQFNEKAIAIDFEWITKDKTSQPIPEYVMATERERIFIEDGAILRPCILNPDGGYIYISKEAEIMEGAMIRGSLALGEHSAIKMGAKIYGATTIGPDCKVGGEVGNVVFFNHSNKGHDGYLGNSVIGNWCNFGADTNSSNLKNNYSFISIWNEHEKKSEATNCQFLGIIMGDHSKSGINTMFNTGTVVSVSCNIYGGGFPEKFIPAFSWGGSEGFTTYHLEKAIDTANKMMARRHLSLTEHEVEVLKYVFEKTAEQRELY